MATGRIYKWWVLTLGVIALIPLWSLIATLLSAPSTTLFCAGVGTGLAGLAYMVKLGRELFRSTQRTLERVFEQIP